MDKKLKEEIGSQNELQEILCIGRTQCWKLWTGKSELTASNKKLIRMTLDERGKHNEVG